MPRGCYAVAQQHNTGQGAPMRTITLVTQKGGTGKTTLASSLALAAMEAGETVALFDLDPQKSLLGWGDKREKAKFEFGHFGRVGGRSALRSRSGRRAKLVGPRQE